MRHLMWQSNASILSGKTLCGKTLGEGNVRFAAPRWWIYFGVGSIEQIHCEDCRRIYFETTEESPTHPINDGELR